MAGSEVIGRGIIEVVADARQLKASIEEAKKAIRTLGAGQIEVSKAAQASIDQYIAKIRQQNAVVGLSTRQAELFKLAQRGASNEQINAANAALKVKERHEQMVAAGRTAQTIFLAIAAAAGTAAVAYGTLALRNAEFAGKLKDLSKSTGISVEDLAGLSLLAKQNGTDLNSLAESINKVTVAIGKNPEEFKALGVSAKDGVGALKQISDIFKDLPDLTTRNALAQKIFSRSWAEMAPILSLGGEEIGRVIARGKQLSGVTQDVVDRADEFNSKLEELKISTAALGTTFLPMLTSLIQQMLAAKEASDGFVESFARFFMLGGKAAEDPAKAIAELDRKVYSLRATLIELERLEPITKWFSSDDIAIVKAQIAVFETQRQTLEKLAKQKPPTKPQGRFEEDTQAAAQSAGEREKAAKAFLAERDQQLALIKQIAEARAAAAEQAIQLEVAHRQARLAGQEQMISAQRELDQGELQAIAKRVKLVEQAFETEQRLIRAKPLTAQQSDAELLASAKRMYDGLVAKDIEYLNIVKANRQKMAAIEQEVSDTRKRTADFIKGVNREGMTEEQQRQEAFRDAVETESALRAAVVAGDTKKQKELSAEALRTAETLKSLGQGDVAVGFAEEAQRLTEVGLAVQTMVASAGATQAENAAQKVEARMATLSQQIRDVQENALKDMPISLSQSSVKSLIAELQAAIAAEEFVAKIKPQIMEIEWSKQPGGGAPPVPQFASGGRAHGLALVGERGPELVRFLSPAQVYAANETKRILSAMRGIPRLAEGGIVRPAQEQAHDVVDVNLRSGNKVATVSTPREQLHTLLDIVREFSE